MVVRGVIYTLPMTLRRLRYCPRAPLGYASLPWGRYLLVWAVFVVAAVISWRGYDRLPQRFALHWTLFSGPDSFSIKSPGAVAAVGVLVPFVLAVAATIVFFYIRLGLDHADAARLAHADRRLRIWGGYCVWLSTAVTAAKLSQMFDYLDPMVNGIVLIAGISLPTTWLIFCLIKWNAGRTEHGPRRVYVHMFYFHRDNPHALVDVDTEYGRETALNLARPGGWAIAGALGAAVTAVVTAILGA